MSDLNIHQRIFAVMQEVPYIQKDKKAAFGQTKYSFVGHDAVTAKIRPFLIKHGILPYTQVIDHKRDGNLTSVMIEVKLINIDDKSDFISYAYPGTGIDTQDKGVGKAISYAFRYALLKILMLETGDDPESDNIEHINQEQMKEQLFENQKAALEELLKNMAAAYEDKDKEKFREINKNAKFLASKDDRLQPFYVNAFNIIKETAQQEKESEKCEV